MSAMSVLFAQQMQAPTYNMLQGPLLSLLLIQTQYMKREMLRQMNALDTLLRENLFTASMSALLPGVLAVGAATTVVRRFIRVIRSRRRSRRSLVKQVRSVMRDAERLFIRNIALGASAASPSASGRLGGGGGTLGGGYALGGAYARARVMLSDVDTGLLVISLHVLRQTVERHKELLSSGERASFFEDLEDLCVGAVLTLGPLWARSTPWLLPCFSIPRARCC